MNHIVIDLETLSTQPHASIISIAAVAFDDVTGETLLEFKRNIEPSPRLHIDPKTVMWWLNLPKDAQDALQTPKPMSIEQALEEFAFAIRIAGPDALVWGNGATFDNVILASAYQVLGVKRPWGYKTDRCYRTIRAVFPNVPEPARIGVPHEALDDARHEAKHLLAILQHIRELGKP